jgi:hypothetical protein
MSNVLCAATFRSPHLGTSNESVVTFCLEGSAGDTSVRRFAARVNAAHTAMTAVNTMGRSQMVGFTARNASATVGGVAGPAFNVVPTVVEYLEELGKLNLDPGFQLLLAGGAPVQPTPAPYQMSGEPLYLPIGTSIMVTEVGTQSKGRAFLPFPSYYSVEYSTGKVTGLSAKFNEAIWAWLHKATADSETDLSVPNTFVYSRKNNTSDRIQGVKVRQEFSNLASRRR